MYLPIWYDTIPEFYEKLMKRVQFSYVNPLTQEEIIVDLKNDLGLRNTGNVRTKLKYIEELTDFYISNRRQLEPIINNKKPAFILPKFPINNFQNDDYVRKENVVQRGFLHTS